MTAQRPKPMVGVVSDDDLPARIEKLVAASTGTVPTIPAAPIGLDVLDWIAQPDEATAWLVDGLVPARALSIITGEPKSYKSMAALHLAAAVAGTATTWLGHTVGTHGQVLYVLEEGSSVKTKERLRHILQAGGMTAPNRLRFAHRTGVKMDDAASWAGVRATLDAMDSPVLCVLDTYARLVDGAENDDTTAKAAVDALNRLIADYGVGTVLVHHSARAAEGRPGRFVRGHGALSGAADMTMLFERASDMHRDLKPQVTVRTDPRDAEPVRLAFTFDETTFALDPDAGPPALTAQLVAEIVAELVATDGPTTATKVADHYVTEYAGNRPGRSWLGDLMTRAVAERVIRVAGHRGRAVLYAPPGGELLTGDDE